MKVLSIDVGIKNLAFCLFEKSIDCDQFTIKKWDVINISEKDTYVCGFIDKNSSCNKPAKFKKSHSDTDLTETNICYCLKHAKKSSFQIPKSENSPKFINKQNMKTLYEIANKYNIVYDSKIKKQDLIHLINEHIHCHYFQLIENTNASEIDLFNIGLNIQNKFNTIFENENQINYIIIENQISPIATRMKTIQGMIVQYFIMSNITVEHIKFISASNKLKFFNNTKQELKEKTKYSDRKKLGIQKTTEFLTNHFHFQYWNSFFNNHKKKDDLADSFLQGLWFVKNQL